MSTQTLYQGSPRPARIPAITVVHPGLQVHAIAAPKTDRRLSFLLSANLYCAFAAGVVLMAQAAPAFKPLIKTDREPPVVELRPTEAAPRIVAAVAPPRINSWQPSTPTPQLLTEPQPVVDPVQTPTSIGTTDESGRNANPSNLPPGGGHGDRATNGTWPGPGPAGPEAGQVMEVSASAVRVLQQIQPVYPNLARLAHKEGDVVLIMTINELGVPIEVKMASGEAIFRNDAIRAAQQWRFTAATLDGHPHTARFKLTLQFRLRG